MARRPYSAQGTLVRSSKGWHIELHQESLSTAEGEDVTGTAPLTMDSLTTELEGLDEGSAVRLLFWTESPLGQLSEYEAIAERQQLDLTVVAHALEAEGSLSADPESFLNRLSQ